MLSNYAASRLRTVRGHLRLRRVRMTLSTRYQSHSPNPFAEFEVVPCYKTRLFRSLKWATLFGAAGVSLVAYIQAELYEKEATVKIGSTSDAFLIAENMRRMNEMEVIRALQDDASFTEIWPLATHPEAAEEWTKPGNRDARQHFVCTALGRSRGVFPRAFFSESKGVLCLIVRFSYGVEGRPGMCHGGVVATMVHEGMRVLARKWFPDDSIWRLADLDMNYDQLPTTNGVFSITIMPASTIKDLPKLLSNPEEFGNWPGWLDNAEFAERVNLFLAVVGTPSGHPLQNRVQLLSTACGRFEVEAPDWPPEKPQQSPKPGIGSETAEIPTTNDN